MDESTKTKALRLRREDAVQQILAKSSSTKEVAEEFGISRQAVSLWVQRYKKSGTLRVERKGRKKLAPFTLAERRQFSAMVIALYKKMGYRLGDNVPEIDQIENATLIDFLKQISDRPPSAHQAHKLLKELDLPPHSNPFTRLGEDDRAKTFYPLHDPFKAPSPESTAASGTDQPGTRDQLDEAAPSTSEEYDQWIKDSKRFLEERGIDYDPVQMGVQKPKGPGGRGGKQTKGASHTPPKRRKKKARRRR